MEEKNKNYFLNIIIFLVILMIGIVLYAKYLGVKGLIVKEYRVKSEILTSNFNGIKIAHFSDLLFNSTVDKDDVEYLVKSINVYKPDIVIFSGDLVDIKVKITNEQEEYLSDVLSKIDASIGKYAISGDYDYKSDNYKNIMENGGFKLLDNTYEEVFYNSNESLYIAGIPSISNSNYDINSAFKFYDEETRKFTIVIIHEGNTIKLIDDEKYETDLILGGHSLNGSVYIPFYGPLYIEEDSSKYYAPYYEKGITKIYISSGIGTNKYKYRIFNKPSYNLYRLESLSNN